MTRVVPALALLGALLVAGCDAAEPISDVNPDRVWVRYELIYDGQNDRTEARASFRFGNPTGTQLRLTDGASVSFEGRTLEL